MQSLLLGDLGFKSHPGVDALNVLEYQSNAWGQSVLQGVSWDLIWIFAAAGLAVIICHLIFLLRRKRVTAAGDIEAASLKHADE